MFQKVLANPRSFQALGFGLGLEGMIAIERISLDSVALYESRANKIE